MTRAPAAAQRPRRTRRKTAASVLPLLRAFPFAFGGRRDQAASRAFHQLHAQGLAARPGPARLKGEALRAALAHQAVVRKMRRRGRTRPKTPKTSSWCKLRKLQSRLAQEKKDKKEEKEVRTPVTAPVPDFVPNFRTLGQAGRRPGLHQLDGRRRRSLENSGPGVYPDPWGSASNFEALRSTEVFSPAVMETLHWEPAPQTQDEVKPR